MKAYRFTVSKSSQRHLDTRVMKGQLDKIVNRMLSGGRGNVWSVKYQLHEPQTIPGSEAYSYTSSMVIRRTGRDIAQDVYDQKVAYMLKIGQAAANASAWTFPDGDSTSSSDSAIFGEASSAVSNGATNEPAVSNGATESNGPTETNGQALDDAGAALLAATAPALKMEAEGKTYSSRALPTETGEFFNHIYERDAQIAVVHSAVKAFVDSEFSNRFHCVLFGEPACGKTEILRSFTRMLGNNFVLELDATSTTKAGAERILLESKNLPPVLVCEEIEKTDENSLRWLLGILDHRGEVRKVTHNAGLRHRDVKMLCLATVNDMTLFKRVMDGALASRFSHKVWCPRPSKAVLKRILAREIAKMPDGSPAWIDPAVDWCVDIEGTNDPRRVTTVCISGREKLLTGEYQRLLAEVSDPANASVAERTAQFMLANPAEREANPAEREDWANQKGDANEQQRSY
jgi:hypothetical protein